MESSILDSIGHEIIGVMSPVSICMFLVVFLIYTLLPIPTTTTTTITTAATLVYRESSTDSNAQKLGGAFLNALVFIFFIVIVTFLLVLLYYYNFTNFLKNYMRFSTFFVFASMGGSILITIVHNFSIPIDSITFFVVLSNLTIVGVLSMFSKGIPIVLKQTYMVLLGIIVAVWFTRLPEWTTWILLLALALYDLVAVLVPGGPLRLLVELASRRGEELPALVYEARSMVSRREDELDHLSSIIVLVGESSRPSGCIELQGVTSTENNGEGSSSHLETRNTESREVEIEKIGETSPLVSNIRQNQLQRMRNLDHTMINVQNMASEGDQNMVSEPVMVTQDRTRGRRRSRRNTGSEDIFVTRGIRLGLGDFVFYSVLVGRAAMYDLMTVYACYLVIISGLGCTLILLAVCEKALPALPISITLGVMFYFLTWLLMEPFLVGTSTNLLMF